MCVVSPAQISKFHMLNPRFSLIPYICQRFLVKLPMFMASVAFNCAVLSVVVNVSRGVRLQILQSQGLIHISLPESLVYY